MLISDFTPAYNAAATLDDCLRTAAMLLLSPRVLAEIEVGIEKVT